MYKYAPIALAPLILAKTISRSRKVRADEKVRRASAAKDNDTEALDATHAFAIVTSRCTCGISRNA